MTHRSVFVHFVFSIALCWSAAAGAVDYNCSISDPTGDPVLSPGQGHDGEGYQDILVTRIERSGDQIVFSMDVAAPIPTTPGRKNPNGSLLWMWGMNTGPGVPQGFPLSPGLAGLLEFWVHVAWNGTDFDAVVIDRRPALDHGGAPVVTRVPFEVDGASVSVMAPATLFDDPAIFRWGSSTWMWPTHLGTSSPKVVDRAPDGAAVLCPES